MHVQACMHYIHAESECVYTKRIKRTAEDRHVRDDAASECSWQPSSNIERTKTRLTQSKNAPGNARMKAWPSRRPSPAPTRKRHMKSPEGKGKLVSITECVHGWRRERRRRGWSEMEDDPGSLPYMYAFYTQLSSYTYTCLLTYAPEVTNRTTTSAASKPASAAPAVSARSAAVAPSGGRPVGE